MDLPRMDLPRPEKQTPKVFSVLSCGVIPVRRNPTSQNQLQLLLVQQRDGSHWSFPKGHVESGEIPFETALRELREETGLLLWSLLSDERIEEQYTFSRGPQTVEKRVIYFLATIRGALQIQEKELLDARWCSPEEAHALATFPETKQTVEQALCTLSTRKMTIPE